MAEYEQEEEYEEGLTFKKVGRFFKVGWLRMVVYAVIAALLVTAVAVPIKVFYKSEPVAQTTIEYIYDGAEKGLAPDGSAFSTDNIISTTVLNNAVKAANLEGIVPGIADLRAKMRVEAVLTDEYRKLASEAAGGSSAALESLRNMRPTKYDIIISDPDSLGLSDDQAVALLEKVVECYYRDFVRRYTPDRLEVGLYDRSGNDDMEFVFVYDMYIESLNAVERHLDVMTKLDPDFVSVNGTTFSGLSGELKSLVKRYDFFNARVISSNIWRDPTSARSTLVTEKASIQAKLTPLTEYITALKEQIQNFKPTTVTAVDEAGKLYTTTSYSPEYFELQTILDESNRKVLTYKTRLAVIDNNLSSLTDAAASAAQIAETARELARLEEETVELVNRISDTVTTYYDTAFAAASVTKLVQPTVMRRSLDFELWLVYVIGVIAALVVAGIVTAVKISAANDRKNVESAAQEQSAEESGK